MKYYVSIFPIIIVVYVAVLLGKWHTAFSSEAPKDIVFYGGNKGGVFDSIASSFCTVINKNYPQKYNCIAVESNGAQDNLNKVIKGKVDFAITKPFGKYSLYMGEGNLKETTKKEFVSVFTLHEEQFSLLVTKESDINSMQDLHNKSITIGSVGSASNIMIREFFAAFNYKPMHIHNYSIITSMKKLCNNDIDAMLYYIGHPNLTYKQAMKDCNLRLISLSKGEIIQLLMSSEYNKQSSIKKSSYDSLTDDIKTVSSPAILVAKKNIDEGHIDFFKEFVILHREELIKIDSIFEKMEFIDLYKYNNK